MPGRLIERATLFMKLQMVLLMCSDVVEADKHLASWRLELGLRF